jgi:hypothetical protein
MTLFADLPYPVHTGRELELMLAGVKPLAVFYHSHPDEPSERIIPENAFKPYVDAGKFEKREFVTFLDTPPPATHRHVKGIRWVLYALPEENWRIDAFLELKAEADVRGWSEEFERREGFLYGYEDWQMDAWIAHLLRSPEAEIFPWLRRLAEKRRTAKN